MILSSASKFGFQLIPRFPEKIVSPQWYWAVAAYSRARPPDSAFSLHNCPYLDFQKKWFRRNDSHLFQLTPKLRLQIPILSCFNILRSASRSRFQPRELPLLWFPEKMVSAQWFWVVSAYSKARPPILSCFNILQSAACRSQCQPPELRIPTASHSHTHTRRRTRATGFYQEQKALCALAERHLSPQQVPTESRSTCQRCFCSLRWAMSC